MNEPINEQKERVFTFYSNLKSEAGHVEIKFDFKESEFKQLSEQQEGEIQNTTYEILCGVEKLRGLLEEITKKPTHIAEFSIYEEPNKTNYATTSH